jgi:hypothetical protein
VHRGGGRGGGGAVTIFQLESNDDERGYAESQDDP